MGNKIVDPNLVFIRLARKMGYNVFITKELMLTEILEVTSSNRFTRSIFVRKEKKEVAFSVRF